MLVTPTKLPNLFEAYQMAITKLLKEWVGCFGAYAQQEMIIAP